MRNEIQDAREFLTKERLDKTVRQVNLAADSLLLLLLEGEFEGWQSEEMLAIVNSLHVEAKSLKNKVV